MKGFIDFIREQGVVGLAVGFILGGSVTKVVSSLVNDIVSPTLSILTGAKGNFKDSFFQIGTSKILYGNFLSTLADFLVIAVVVYYGVKGLKLDRLDRKKS